MKRTVILALVLAVCLALPAAASAKNTRGKESVDAGSILISGQSDFGFGYVGETYDSGDIKRNTTAFQIGLIGGYFVIDGLNVGMKFLVDYSLTSTKSKGEKAVDDAVTTIDWLPYVRYYFLHDFWVKPFVNGGIGVRHIMADGENLDSWSTVFCFWGGGGVALFLTDRISLDLGLDFGYGFGNLEYKIKGHDKEKESGGRFDVNMLVGFTVYFL